MSHNVLGIHEASYYIHLCKFRECRVIRCRRPREPSVHSRSVNCTLNIMISLHIIRIALNRWRGGFLNVFSVVYLGLMLYDQFLFYCSPLKYS
jgi:hypothetical protein